MNVSNENINIPDEAHDIINIFSKTLQYLYISAEETFNQDTDMNKAEITGTLAHVLLTHAAALSIKTRAELLDGDPDIKRWRKVTDAIWKDAFIGYNSDVKENASKNTTEKE